jgi:hypothetical protein
MAQVALSKALDKNQTWFERLPSTRTQSLTCSSNFKHKLAVHVSMTRKADRCLASSYATFVAFPALFSALFCRTTEERTLQLKLVALVRSLQNQFPRLKFLRGGAFAVFRSDSEILDRPVTYKHNPSR